MWSLVWSITKFHLLYKMRPATARTSLANELLTLSECRHINAPIEKLEKVTMKKTDAYHMFGARFACND